MNSIATGSVDGGADEQSLARDMIEVHGLRATAVARDNARNAALAGQAALAKSWIRVLGIIQRSQATRQYNPSKGRDFTFIPTGLHLNRRITQMYISLSDSRTNGFKRWSNDHRPNNDDDDNPGGATPIAIAVPLSNDRDAVDEPPHRPWAVPGVGGSF